MYILQFHPSSVTQYPCEYTVETSGDYILHLIDTPGVGDTRGTSYDEENFKNIIEYIRNYKVCIIIVPCIRGKNGNKLHKAN